MIRRLNQGFELFGKYRFTYNKNWRSKPHPFYFRRKYVNGPHTIQIMRYEYWRF